MEEKALREFRHRKFGMFIHWGLYAVPGGRWNGEVMTTIGEWFQSYFRMPGKEYQKFAAQFNPVKFNADEWIRKASAAGVKYIVFTTKHHEGFCMYDTKISDYNIVTMTPFGRDPLKELQYTCARYGVKLGVYYSHHLDWHEKDAGDPGPDFKKNAGRMSWGNDWDFPDASEKNFANYFYGKVIPQVTELLTNYGDICELWCDCPLDMKPEFSQVLRKVVKELQPGCMINSRIGNNCHDFIGLGDNQILSNKLAYPVESPGTLNNTWGFKYDDHNWKSTEQIISQLVALAAKNANYLLNIGPMPTGEWTPETDRIFAGLAQWIADKKDAIHGTEPNPFPQELGFAECTTKEADLNLFLRNTPDTIQLSGIKNKVVAANVPFSQTQKGITLSIPEELKKQFLPLVKLTFDGVPEINPAIVPQNGELVLGMSIARIHLPAQADSARQQVLVDVAGMKHDIQNRARLDRDGTLCEWDSTDDYLEWNVAFPQGGEFQVSLISKTRWSKDQPWDGDSKVFQVLWNGQAISAKLNKDEELLDQYSNKFRSVIGTLHMKPGTAGVLTLKMLENTTRSPGNLNLVVLELKKTASRD